MRVFKKFSRKKFRTDFFGQNSVASSVEFLPFMNFFTTLLYEKYSSSVTIIRIGLLCITLLVLMEACNSIDSKSEKSVAG
jgi:hypothetical protein